MHANHIEEFRGAILSAGLTPPDNITDDGKLIRFNGTGKRGNTREWIADYINEELREHLAKKGGSA